MSRVGVFFNDTATTEIYTLSLHDALPISADAPPGRPPGGGQPGPGAGAGGRRGALGGAPVRQARPPPDRKSTRLNSSHANISYAVFCLKKKKQTSTSHTCELNSLTTLVRT